MWSSLTETQLYLMISSVQLVSSMMTFFLAMIKYPEVQKRAQQELDLVIGADKLPSCADLERLPYVRAVLSEVYRWHPVAPLGEYIV